MQRILDLLHLLPIRHVSLLAVQASPIWPRWVRHTDSVAQHSAVKFNLDNVKAC